MAKKLFPAPALRLPAARPLALTPLALAALLACNKGDAPQQPPPEQATLAIEGVSVIPMDSQRVLSDMTVLVGGGRVLAVQPSGEAEIPDGATRVDGRGGYLIPGLNDMHVHFQEEQALGRFLATGAGQASIEHLRGYIWYLVPADAANQPGADLRSRTLAWADGDLSRIRELAERTRDGGVWSVPTLAVRMILKPDYLVEAYLATEEASHMTEGMRAFYTERMSIPWMSNFGPDDFEAAMDGFAVADSLVRALVGVRAPLMAGTDTPPLGFALHRELEELVGAGLSPYEALVAATVNPARFLGRDEGAGMVVEGSPADLVLLDGNPLEDIGNTRRIAGVVRRGEWLDRATLDAMLEEGAGR